MSKARKKVTTKIEEYVNQQILVENLEDIVGERFGRYSKYIIQDRALPDVRDGLKPVQRRILYAMYRLGVLSNKPYKKSARIVGDVIGKYHPHGDSSVYEAMVRMAQEFKILMPLVDMHGNKGSIDGDPAAAMRYTEARLSKISEYLLQNINKRTVGFVPNFDDEEYEPTVLPAKFPNLLVNGGTGISAGYATDIPPHNIDEVMKAVIYRIKYPTCSLKDLMKIVQGPDFPTGGIVQGIHGIKSAYETGRGKIIIKSKTEIVEAKNMNQLIVTEIPFEVNKSVLVKRMSEVHVQKNIDGVLDIRDESDRQGLRIVVDIKKDVNPEDIRNFFFKSTDLQVNYHFNMVCISNKRPMLMGLIDIVDAYITHQREVITNRSNFELSTAKKRLHIVEGLIAMTSILDSVIRTIRNSLNKKDAKDNLMINYNFTEAQAEAIVTLQLYRLTNTDIVSLENEEKILNEQIDYLNSILSNDDILMKTIEAELKETAKNLSTPRKSIIEHDIDEVKVEVKELIAKEDAYLIITNDGYIKRMTLKSYGAIAPSEKTRIKEDDIIVGTFKVTTLDTLLMFTNLGNYVYLPVQNIPEVRHKDVGYNVSTLVSIETNEKIIFTVPISNFEEEKYLLFTTKSGLIKRTHIKDLIATRYSKALKATKIRGDDELVSVDIGNGPGGEVVVITKEGYMNRYDANEISIIAPASFGVKAIELKSRPSDEVVAGKFVDPKDFLLLLTEKAAVRKMRADEILKGRKNNVGKPYMRKMKTTSNDIVYVDVIRKENANAKLHSYIVGSKSFEQVDYAQLKTATSTSGKKITSNGIGKAQKIILVRNNGDF